MYFNLNSKLLPGKNTQKLNKQKFVFRKIGCSHEMNEIQDTKSFRMVCYLKMIVKGQ